MIINIGQCLDCRKKLKGDRIPVTVFRDEELFKDSGKLVGYICKKCEKKRFSRFLSDFAKKYL